MPSDVQHLSQGNHNLRFLASFCASEDYIDWIITVAFYSAMHVVEYAIFKKDDILYRGQVLQLSHSSGYFAAIRNEELPLPEGDAQNTSTHTARKCIVLDNFREVTEQYYRLANNSRVARYKNHKWSRSKVARTIDDLQAIIEWGNSKFNGSFALTLPTKKSSKGRE